MLVQFFCFFGLFATIGRSIASTDNIGPPTPPGQEDDSTSEVLLPVVVVVTTTDQAMQAVPETVEAGVQVPAVAASAPEPIISVEEDAGSEAPSSDEDAALLAEEVPVDDKDAHQFPSDGAEAADEEAPPPTSEGFSGDKPDPSVEEEQPVPSRVSPLQVFPRKMIALPGRRMSNPYRWTSPLPTTSYPDHGRWISPLPTTYGRADLGYWAVTSAQQTPALPLAYCKGVNMQSLPTTTAGPLIARKSDGADWAASDRHAGTIGSGVAMGRGGPPTTPRQEPRPSTPRINKVRKHCWRCCCWQRRQCCDTFPENSFWPLIHVMMMLS